MSDRMFWLAWSQIPGIGSILLVRLKQHFGSLAIAWTATVDELSAVDGVGHYTAEAVYHARSNFQPEQLLYDHEQQNPHFWTPDDADYPYLLLEMADPPPVLYYRGQINRPENQGFVPAIAIVGTRSPSDYGRRWTHKISVALAQSGFTVVSGLAQGIDTEAHQSCLNAGGRTIAVVGTGVDVVYPWANRALAERIAQQGLILSEYPAGTQPDRVHFPRRNRIIAGLCRATLVLEAPQKSGALITARLANEYSRDVFALPGSLDNSRSIGCLELLNQGAQLILGEAELIEALLALPPIVPISPIAPAALQQLSLLDAMPDRPEPDLEPELRTVLQAVSIEPTTMDHVVQRSGLATDVVLGALLQLELLGWVAQLPGMRYHRI